MEINIEDIFRIIKYKAMDKWSGKMEINMKVNGKMVNLKGLGNFININKERILVVVIINWMLNR